MNLKRIILPFALLPALMLPGCKTATSTTPGTALAPPVLLQGALNQFDQDTFISLRAIYATIYSLNSSYAANPTGLSALKGPLDQAAQDYNIAYLAWETYHGAATSANQAAATSALAKVQLDASTIKIPTTTAP